MAKKGKKKRKAKLSPEEKARRSEQRRLRSRINRVFTTALFKPLLARETEITFKGKSGGFDAIFIHENIVAVVEDTCAKSGNIKDHLNGKQHLYELIRKNQPEFIEFLSKTFSEFDQLNTE